eukprot:491764-Ditylum_brightwellii.AAC.1
MEKMGSLWRTMKDSILLREESNKASTKMQEKKEEANAHLEKREERKSQKLKTKHWKIWTS